MSTNKLSYEQLFNLINSTDVSNDDNIGGVKQCSSCGVDMEMFIDNDDKVVCPKCGLMDDNNNMCDEISAGSQTSYKPPGYLTVGGKYSNRHSRNMISNTADSKHARNRTTKNKIYAFINGGNISVSNDILDMAVELMLKIQDIAIYRGNVRKGLMAACVEYYCKKNNKIISIDNLSKIFSIENKHLLSGRSTINTMINTGAISVKGSESVFNLCNNMECLYNKYFELIGFCSYHDNHKYKDFIKILDKFVLTFKVNTSSTDETRCTAYLCILLRSTDDFKYSSETVSKITGVKLHSSNGFISALENYKKIDDIRYVKTLKKLRHIYKKFGVNYELKREKKH